MLCRQMIGYPVVLTMFFFLNMYATAHIKRRFPLWTTAAVGSDSTLGNVHGDQTTPSRGRTDGRTRRTCGESRIGLDSRGMFLLSPSTGWCRAMHETRQGQWGRRDGVESWQGGWGLKPMRRWCADSRARTVGGHSDSSTRHATPRGPSAHGIWRNPLVHHYCHVHALSFCSYGRVNAISSAGTRSIHYQGQGPRVVNLVQL